MTTCIYKELWNRNNIILMIQIQESNKMNYIFQQTLQRIGKMMPITWHMMVL